MRNLASLQKIVSISPIPNADAIEVAQVLGWSIVVRKGDFKPGDLAVFFEIDSFLNAEDKRYATFEDRFINWDGKRGMRLKTIKLRGQISQGLVLEVHKFPEIKNPVEGMDVTELLKIEKWEVPESNQGGANRVQGSGRTFPSFIQKTDQTRIQSLTGTVFNMLGDTFEESVKLDGSSMTIYSLNQTSPYFEVALEMEKKKVKKNIVEKIIDKLRGWLWHVDPKPEYVSGICSRNILLGKDDTSHFTTYAKEHGLIEKITGDWNYAIQGELIGPSIQNNHEKVSKLEFYVFDVFNIDKQEYLMPSEARAFCSAVGLPYVPVLNKEASLKDLLTQSDDPKVLVDEILNRAEGPGMNPGVKREGKVYKSNTIRGMSFKAISNSYLLKTGK